MFRPVALYIGLRYSRAKRKNHFISIVSLFSMLGIGIGVMALITVLSVMNGFDEAISERIFSMVAHINVNSVQGSLADWQPLEKKLQVFPGVKGTAPYVAGQGLVTYQGQNQPLMLLGILPEQEQMISSVAKKMVTGSLSDLKPGAFNIVMGQQLAQNLSVYVGDKVRIMIPQYVVTPLGVNPVYKRFTVTGIFSVGPGFGLDKLAFIEMSDAQALFNMNDTVTGIRLDIEDFNQAPQIGEALRQITPPDVVANDWTQQYGPLFKTLQLEKTLMFIVLFLIVVVAAFNLISSLVMLVTDKQSDIAILRTLGLTPGTVLRIFIIQGSVVGVIGTLLGTGTGLLLAYNAGAIVSWLQATLNTQLIPAGMYFVDYLPSKIEAREVITITLLSLGMSVLATVYPAYRASRVQPAEALRYE
jgi:lipoprotein-releasing system permease protein